MKTAEELYEEWIAEQAPSYRLPIKWLIERTQRDAIEAAAKSCEVVEAPYWANEEDWPHIRDDFARRIRALLPSGDK